MTVDELKILKDNECILFVRGIYPFFCDKYKIERHPNYKLLEDFDPNNAYLIKDIETVRFQSDDEQENEDLHSEPVDDPENVQEQAAPETSGEDVPENKNDDIEQSIAIEEITDGEPLTGNQNHLHNFPKRPTDGGSEPAVIDDDNIIVTTEPYTEVAEESYLDIFDTI